MKPYGYRYDRARRFINNAYIQTLKAESAIPKGFSFTGDDRCNAICTDNILDDWGDSCGGAKCKLVKDHDGVHSASDGANGFISW